MKKNIQIIGFLMILILIFGSQYVSAANDSNISTSLSGSSPKVVVTNINNRNSPAFYTKSATYNDVMVAMRSEDTGDSSEYRSVPIGTTFNFTQPSSIQGGEGQSAVIISLLMKSRNFHIINNVSGIFFH